MATSESTRTMANGISIKKIEGRDNAHARELAAALPRGAGHIDRIRPHVAEEQMVVHIDDGCRESFHAPDGWEIVSVFVSSKNATAVRVRRA